MEDDLTPVELNIKRVRGDSMQPVVVTISRPTPSGPQPLVIEDAAAQVRRKKTHTSSLVLTLPCPFLGNEVRIGEGANITAAVGTYFWDLEITYDSGKTLTTHAGTFTVLPDVTEVSP